MNLKKFFPVAQTDASFNCFNFFFEGWLWRSCTKGEEMLTKLFIQSKVIWKSLFLLSNCVNERGPKEKTVARSRRKTSA